ncbi:MAG: 2-C-methyl-D-erythritol 4-phosphate cytidylyltransferase [Pyrinomonadaceae bacterium]
MNTAIVVAAGTGSRFGSDRPKQFREIAGKPVVFHALERFASSALVDEIIVVLAASEIERCREMITAHPIQKLIRIVEGGGCRAESSLNGFRAVDRSSEIVAVHDGARPLVTVEDIERVIEKATEMGAACLVAPMTETIKEISSGTVVATLDRSTLRRVLTPQAFRYDILAKAFAHNHLDDSITDESVLVEKLGYAVSVVEGDPRNIKITNPEDLVIAEIFLNSAGSAAV